MADFDSVNNNEGLWKLIQDSIFSLSNRFQSILKKEDFQYKFRITENCWQEGNNFINVGEIFLPILLHIFQIDLLQKNVSGKKNV